MPANEETLKVAPKAPVFYLAYSLPDRATVRVALEPDTEIVFGRATPETEVQVTIDDPRVSRRHASVRRDSRGLVVRDLRSSNGTLVCGEVLRGGERRVGAGDVFTIGPMHVVVAAASAHLVVADPAMRKLHAAAQRVARRTTPVLLLGEPGVGKKALAERIHDASARADRPFVVFRCGSIAESDVEPEIFGDVGRTGLLDAAHTGTLLLADVELLPRTAQKRLGARLRAPVSDAGKRRAGADARILCTSSADLGAAVDAGHFDAGLYALLSTLAARVPPLRERTIEIPVLAAHLLAQIAEPLAIEPPSVTPAAARLLEAYSWPRNVSDLRDVLEYAVALSEDGTIGPAELPVSFTDAGERAARTGDGRGLARQQAVLHVDRAGLSFRIPPAESVSLARRGALRRILLCLVQARDASAGRAVPADDLFAAGWPGERPVGQSAEGRVRTAVWMLRRLGLHDLLATRDDGYLLVADMAVEWA